MKLIFVIPGMGFGGAERVVSILANTLSREHEVCIILSSGENVSSYPLESAVQLKGLPQNLGTIKRWYTLRKYCKEFQADVVLSFMDTVSIMTALSLMFTRIPVIASERNDPSEKSRQLPLLMRILKRISVHLMAGYVFQSEGAKGYYPKRAQRKSVVILNPVDTDRLPTRDTGSVENRVVTVGRLHAQKNQKMLIDAFAASKFSRTHTLHIYGEGELRTSLEQQIRAKNLEDKVFLEGNQSNVLDIIKNVALFAFTSDYEGLPNALIEAMAMGIPCISTDCSPGGARMLIEDGKNGFLVDCGDTEGLIKAFDRMYTDPNRMADMGAQAREICFRVDTQMVCQQWISFIESCLQKE